MSEKSLQRRQELMQKLEHGFQAVRESDRFMAYLDTCAKFHNYSPQNAMLIMLQRPASTHVAGFNSWIGKFNRRVNKGEKGIAILAPTRFQAKEEDEEGNVTQRDAVGFRTVYVFDVSQTDGDPLPTPNDELEGVDDAGLFAALDTLAHSEGITVDRADGRMNGGANGFYRRDSHEIWIRPDVSLVMAAKTFAHELAHHFAEHDTNGHCREEKETIAESVAYIVLGHFGIDASGYSFGYLATWTDPKIFKSKLREIHNVAKQIINAIEGAEETPRPVHPSTAIIGKAVEQLAQAGRQVIVQPDKVIDVPDDTPDHTHDGKRCYKGCPNTDLGTPIATPQVDSTELGTTPLGIAPEPRCDECGAECDSRLCDECLQKKPLSEWASAAAKRTYKPAPMSSGFPNRKGWPKNTKGGFKVSPYPIKRTRHEGVRCYGEHIGKKCYKYDFSRNPAYPWSTFISTANRRKVAA